MSPRLRPVWVLAAAVVLVVAGCGTSADPDTWDEAEEDARFVEVELESRARGEERVQVRSGEELH